MTFTATVTRAGAAVPGLVEFYDGPTLIGASSLSARRAALTTMSLTIGSHAITARYTGVGDLPPVRSAVFVQTVDDGDTKPRATTTALTASPNPVALGSVIRPQKRRHRFDATRAHRECTV